MQIEVIEDIGVATLKIGGIVKTLQDSMEIRSIISSMIAKHPKRRITLDRVGAFVLPSAVIGTLLKFIQADGANINIIVRQVELWQLLSKLHLIALLNVSNMSTPKDRT